MIGKINADLRGDIRNGQFLKDIFEQYQPEIVFHMAAQPLVRLFTIFLLKHMKLM